MVHIGYFRDPYFISESIKRMLEDEGDFIIAFETHTLSDLLFKLRHHEVNILVLVSEGDLDTLKDIIGVMKKEHAKIPIAYIQSNYDMVKAKELEKCGITVLINKMTPLSLVDILDHTAAKENNSEVLSIQRKKQFQLSTGHASHAFSLLNEVEKNILCLLAKNISRKDIADKLCISINTVNKYIQNAKEKCHCKNTFDLLTLCANDISKFNNALVVAAKATGG